MFLRTPISLLFGMFALLAGCAAPSPTVQLPHFAVTDQVRVGGIGGWDFITYDPDGERLFISRGDRVQVWSSTRREVVGEIAGTAGVHGIALAPELGRGFTSDGRSNSITVFGLRDLKVVANVPVPGANPDAILFEPKFKRVYAFNGRSHDVAVLDAVTLHVIASIPLGGKPEVAVSDPEGHVFVNIEDTSEIAEIDPATNKVLSRWPLHPCEEPTGLAIDKARARLFAVCANHKMVIVDATTGKLVGDVPIDAEPDGAEFDPGLGIAWSANGEGTLTMVREDEAGRYRVVGTVPTQPRARTLALDARSHRVYLVTARFGTAPAPTPDAPRPRPPMVPDSFEILVVGPH